MANFAPTVAALSERTFLVVATDRQESAAIRQRELDGHLEFVEKNCDRYFACGPIRNAAGSGLAGSFFLVAADDEQQVRDFLSGDPYVASGMYASISVQEVTVAAGRWLQGVIWESADAIRDRAS